MVLGNIEDSLQPIGEVRMRSAPTVAEDAVPSRRDDAPRMERASLPTDDESEPVSDPTTYQLGRAMLMDIMYQDYPHRDPRRVLDVQVALAPPEFVD